VFLAKAQHAEAAMLLILLVARSTPAIAVIRCKTALAAEQFLVVVIFGLTINPYHLPKNVRKQDLVRISC
jgi:hypothetical protein